MKLASFHVREYKSVTDSNQIDVGEVTCLVGKNESGKTSLLQALYKLNPIIAEHGKYDVTDEYPRAEVEDYRQEIEAGKRKPATVVVATFEIDDAELAAIEAEFGKGAVRSRKFTVSKKYEAGLTIGISADEVVAGKALLASAGMDKEISSADWSDLEELAEAWGKVADEKAQAFNAASAKVTGIVDPDEKKKAEAEARQLEESNLSQQRRAFLAEVVKRDLSLYIWDKFLKPNFPKFLYFDEYYQMHGHVNIEALNQRKANNTLEASDHPMLGLIELARLKVDELTAPNRTEELISKLEGASNHLSKQILKYWSQNKHLTVRFTGC